MISFVNAAVSGGVSLNTTKGGRPRERNVRNGMRRDGWKCKGREAEGGEFVGRKMTI